MAKTANDLLQGILGVVSQIDRKMEKDKKVEKTSRGPNVKDVLNISSSLMKFGAVKPVTTKRFITFMNDVMTIVKNSKDGKGFKIFSDGIVSISNSLPDLVRGLSDLGRLRARRVDGALGSLRNLYGLLYEMGDGRSARKIYRSLDILDKLGRSLNKVARPLRTISSFLTYLGMSIVVFAVSMVAASALLGVGTRPREGEGGLILPVLGVIGGTVAVLVGAVGLLALANKFIKPGIDTIKGIGKGFMYLSLGILGFTLSLLAVASYLGTGKSVGGILGALGVLSGVILATVGMFALLGIADKWVNKGTRAIQGMGVGLFVLVGGIMLFTVGLASIATVLSLSKNPAGIALAMGAIALSIGTMVGMFYVLGKAEKSVMKGAITASLVAAGLTIIGFSTKYFVDQVKAIQTTISGNKETRRGPGAEIFGFFGALGAAGLIFAGATAGLAFLGASGLFIPIALGASAALLVGATLITFAHSVKKLTEVSSQIPANFRDQIGMMISGVFGGMMDGFSVLTGNGDNVFSKGFNVAVNTAKIMAVTGILMGASISLSMFAKALSAFANLSEMRPIIGTKPNGEPIFGDKVNLTNVGQNISTTIHDFLLALISSTEGLTREQARGIKKMGRALTGKRGILSGVIQFADALKVYAQFGEDNQIGYVDYDENGKEIRKSVHASVVVDNMISSFLYFTNNLFKKTEDEFGNGEPGISGRQKRRMKRMSKALTGKHGILGAVMSFAETLKMFSDFGENNELPIIDEEGKPTGKYLSVGTIADNIVKTLTTFSDTLANKLEKGKVKDASKALKKYDKMIDQLHKLSSSMDGLTRMSASITELGEGIGVLAVNLDKLNVDKLGKISNISEAYLEKTDGFTNSNERIMNKTQQASTRRSFVQQSVPEGAVANYNVTSTTSKNEQKPVKWDEISQMIGEEVGARVSAALKNGQFVFEFDTTKSGGIYYWNPA